MLSYPIDEADELLTTRLATAKLNLTNCEEDLDFLREQVTVCILHEMQMDVFILLVVKLIIGRLWRLLRHECIIGM